MPVTRSAGQVLLQQSFGAVESPHQRAGGRHSRHEFEQQVFHHVGLDGAERRHHHRQLAHFVVVEQRPDLAAILLSERQHQDRGALRAAQRRSLRAIALTARQRGDDAGDVVGICGLRYGHVRSRRLRKPLTNNGSGFVRVSLGQFADAMHRLGVDLALNLGDVDHGRGGVGTGHQTLAGGGFAAVGQCRQRTFAGERGDHFGSEDAPDQRPDHHEQHHEAEQHHHAEFDDVHDVVLGELQHAQQSGRLDDRSDGRRFREFEIHDLDLVAALLIEADRRAHQRRDAVQLFLAALLVDHLALFVLGIAAVDQHGDRDPVDPSGLGHFGLGGVGNLVIVGFFGLLALVLRRRRRCPGADCPAIRC